MGIVGVSCRGTPKRVVGVLVEPTLVENYQNRGSKKANRGGRRGRERGVLGLTACAICQRRVQVYVKRYAAGVGQAGKMAGGREKEVGGCVSFETTLERRKRWDAAGLDVTRRWMG